MKTLWIHQNLHFNIADDQIRNAPFPYTHFSFHGKHICSFSIFVSPSSSKAGANGQQAREEQGQREDLQRLIRSLSEQVERNSQNEEQRRQSEEQRRQSEEQRRQSEEQRRQNERLRMQDEEQRKQNEAQRRQNEEQRWKNEEQRRQNEEQRRQNEEHRREDERQRRCNAMQRNPDLVMHGIDQSHIRALALISHNWMSEPRTVKSKTYVHIRYASSVLWQCIDMHILYHCSNST